MLYFVSCASVLDVVVKLQLRQELHWMKDSKVDFFTDGALILYLHGIYLCEATIWLVCTA